MSEQVGKGFDATAGVLPPDRRHALGKQVFFALHSALRNARIHSEDNAVFVTPLEQLRLALYELIATDHSFELKLTSDGLFVNRQIVKLDASAGPLLLYFKSELFSRGMIGLAAQTAPDLADLRGLVRLFTQALSGTIGASGDPSRPLRSLTLLIADSAKEAAQVSRSTRMVAAYSHAVFFVGRTIELLHSGAQVIPAWAASRVVQDLVDLQLEAPLHFLQLAHTKAGGEGYWGYHAANVAVLAISFSARLGFEKRRRHELGMAALFHDVGMAALPAALLNKEEPREQRELAAVKASPLFSARAVLREGEVHAAALNRAQAVYECHLPLTAAPGEAQREIGAMGRILAICEAYDALTTTRPYRRAHQPQKALRIMQNELGKKLDSRLRRLFAQVIESLG